MGESGSVGFPTEVLALLLADSRLPTGAHTQSAGVEPALISGLSVRQVPEYIGTRLSTVTRVEAGVAVLARRAWLAQDLAMLERINAEWEARTISSALRDASHQLARGYLRLGQRLFPDLKYFAGTGISWSRGVVFGALAAQTGQDARTTARLVAFDEMQTIIAAALKLQPFDPAAGAEWSLLLAPQVEAVAAAVEYIETIEELPALTAPLLEHWAQHHSQLERRLFRA